MDPRLDATHHGSVFSSHAVDIVFRAQGQELGFDSGLGFFEVLIRVLKLCGESLPLTAQGHVIVR